MRHSTLLPCANGCGRLVDAHAIRDTGGARWCDACVGAVLLDLRRAQNLAPAVLGVLVAMHRDNGMMATAGALVGALPFTVKET